MKSNKNIEEFISKLRKRLSKEMPKINKEIAIYEKHLAEGKLIKAPKVSPQFSK
jgi:hypothetical protein